MRHLELFRVPASTKGNSMIAMERTPGLDVHSPREAELRVEQTDISFQDLSADCVRISVRIHNDGNHPSCPTIMRLESAPLGAFVPWQPLATLSVPAIEPGESLELSVDARRPQPVDGFTGQRQQAGGRLGQGGWRH